MASAARFAALAEELEDVQEQLGHAMRQSSEQADEAIRWRKRAEAAEARVEQLEADLEQAERERDEWKQAAGAEAELADAFNADLGIQRADLKAAEARVEQLEAALAMLEYDDDTIPAPVAWPDAYLVSTLLAPTSGGEVG